MITPEPKTILFVEDQRTTVLIVSEQLRNFGYHVVTVDTGEKAVALVAGGEKLDLVLMDIFLGEGIDGIEAAKHILVERNIPVVFFTNHSNREIVEKARGIARFGYVLKNSDPFILQSTLEMAFELFEATTRLKCELSERKQAEESLRRSQEKYRIVADNTYDWEFWIDQCGQFIYNSPSCARMTGYDADVFLHDPDMLKKIICDEDRLNVMEYVNGRAMNMKQEGIEFRVTHADGGLRWIDLICKPVFDDVGTSLGLRGSGRDITERKTTEQLLRDIQRKESLGILSSGIAHDYNNLLGIMMGNASLAQAHLPMGHPAAKNIEKSILAMDRAAALTQQMLAYAGKGKLHNQTIDLADEIHEHVILLKVSLSKNVRLVVQIPPTPVYVDGDPGQIEQIIMNLIVNGGEAIGESRGVVSITLSTVKLHGEALLAYGERTDSSLNDGDYALLEVKDTGCGMSREMITKIFDPFFTTKFTGRGLGLSAVIGIVHAHKGGISVESTEGVGTTFRVILPIAHAFVSAKDPVTFEHPTQTLVLGCATILVIDDEADVAAMAQEILETEQYTVLVELNPITGIERYKQFHSHIGAVLLDLTMPDMSGKEAVEALQAIDPDVCIIITSGYSVDDVMKKLGMVKVSGFIQKPYRLQSLLGVMHSVLPSV